MSVKVMSAVWEYGPGDSTRKFVLLALADNASDDGGNTYPSVETLATKCSLSQRTVVRAIESLVKDGYLIRKRRQSTSNMYQIVLSRLIPDNPVSDNLTLTETDNSRPVSDNLTSSNVTESHLRGDTVSLDPSINHPINHPTTTPPKPEEVEVVLDDPVLALAEHFATKAGIVAGVPDVHASMYQDYWKPTLSAILNRVGGDEEMARAVVDASIAFCWGKGTNTSGKTYPLSNPHSIRNIYINRASELSAHARADDDETIWQRAMACIASRTPPTQDSRLYAAIKAVGWPKLESADEYSQQRLKGQLAHAYRSAT